MMSSVLKVRYDDIDHDESCSVSEIKRAPIDQNLIEDDRVLENLLTSEDKYLPSASTFKCIQTDIQPWMRNKVGSWMLEVCEDQRCEEEVFPLSINFMDRFLSMTNITRQNLQLLGACGIFIASKLKETIPLSAEKLVAYTAHSIQIQDLMDMELAVLSALKWDLCAVAPHDVLDHLLLRLPLTQHALIKRHALTAIALCYALDLKFARYPASMLAAGSICAAARCLLGDVWCQQHAILEHLHAITCIDIDCLQGCQEQIEKTLSKQVTEISCLRLESRSIQPKLMPKTPTDVMDIVV